MEHIELSTDREDACAPYQPNILRVKNAYHAPDICQTLFVARRGGATRGGGATWVGYLASAICSRVPARSTVILAAALAPDPRMASKSACALMAVPLTATS